jgi:hypothetical protein
MDFKKHLVGGVLIAIGAITIPLLVGVTLGGQVGVRQNGGQFTECIPSFANNFCGINSGGGAYGPGGGGSRLRSTALNNDDAQTIGFNTSMAAETDCGAKLSEVELFMGQAALVLQKYTKDGKAPTLKAMSDIDLQAYQVFSGAARESFASYRVCSGWR